MFTIEKKVNLVMRYIASANDDQRDELKKAIVEALREDDAASVPGNNNPDIQYIIIDILKELGTSPHLTGHKYLVRAVELVHQDEAHLRMITKCLYPGIAKEYGSTGSSVEHAIRRAVETTLDRGDMDAIVSVFGNTYSPSRGKLTNSEAIAGLASEVARRLHKGDE